MGRDAGKYWILTGKGARYPDFLVSFRHPRLEKSLNKLLACSH